jgi:hypothetical protein
MSAFARAAISLLRQGYSPVPIRENAKLPMMTGWHALKTTPMSELEIARLARRSPQLGLGVAGGYGGLVPVDVDTDDPAIVDAVASVLPRPVVAKYGKRGFTAFYRSATPIKARKFKTAKPKEKMLVEVLTTGQTLIPPTLHPETRMPYQWLRPTTLFDTPIGQLPEISPDTMLVLEDALAPWLPRLRAYVPAASGEPSPVSATRMQRYARGVLRREAHDLAAMPRDSGRNGALFDAGAKLGKFLHHGVLGLAEIESVLLGACQTNGLIKDDGLRQCKASLASGLSKAANDRLPVLGAYQRRA